MDETKTINRHAGHAVQKLNSMGIIDNAAVGILIKKDCILIEKANEHAYSYYCINYYSGDQYHLENRNSQIDETELLAIGEKISEVPFYGTQIPREGEALIEHIFKEVFIQYGYIIRDGQAEVAKHMYRVLMSREISLSDIPVGMGKTHAYLVAAIVYNLKNTRNLFERQNYMKHTGSYDRIKMPVILSTSSIQLQRAINRIYMPEISKMLLENGIIDQPLTSVIRKGKENYLCDMRLKSYCKTMTPEKKSDSEFKAIQNLLESNVFDLSEISGIRNYDKRKIMVKSELCISCTHLRQCRYQAFLHKAMYSDYDFQICNHNYYFADLLRRKESKRPLLPNYKAVIFDESHKLIQAATDMYSLTISSAEIHLLMRHFKSQKVKEQNRSISIAVQEVEELIGRLYQEFKDTVTKRLNDDDLEKYSIRLTSVMKNLLNRLRLNLEQMANQVPSQNGIYASDSKRIAANMQQIISQDLICWVEHPEDEKKYSLHGVGKNIEDRIQGDMFAASLPIILTSGTIAVDGNFDYYEKSLGLDRNRKRRIQRLSMPSPYDYEKNTLIYQAPEMPYPDNDDESYIQRISREIEILINASCGHALVLFTSYKPMRRVYHLLKEKEFDFPIFQMNKGNMAALEQYRNSQNGVLLACGAAWEGIDFKGDVLSHLIIVKLPFLIPDPITDFQKSGYEDFEDFRKGILIPRMLIRLKQGHGRAIRSETDTAVISILDPRADNSYKDNIRTALPDCQITHEIGTIKKWFLEKKDTSYFENNTVFENIHLGQDAYDTEGETHEL